MCIVANHLPLRAIPRREREHEFEWDEDGVGQAKIITLLPWAPLSSPSGKKQRGAAMMDDGRGQKPPPMVASVTDSFTAVLFAGRGDPNLDVIYVGALSVDVRSQ
jgi:hypothetical protein